MDIRQETKSIRPFIGSKDYQTSRSFYQDLGFEEKVISEKMSLFTKEGSCFYLQDYYVKDWIENTMLVLEVRDINGFYRFLQELELDKRYTGIRLMAIQENDWGKECMLIDPSGVLWHFAEFKPLENSNQESKMHVA